MKDLKRKWESESKSLHGSKALIMVTLLLLIWSVYLTQFKKYIHTMVDL